MSPAFSLLTVCGLDELEAHAGRGVTHVLSILDPGRDDHPAFGLYGAHRRLLLRFHDDIEARPGVVLPGPADVEAVLAFGRDAFAGGDGHLLVHCHMGISRSTAALMALLAQAHPELDAAAVAGRVRDLRPIAWPNLRMVELADGLLGRGGGLAAAAASLYAGNLRRRPDLAEIMTRLSRGREVALGHAAPPLPGPAPAEQP